MKYTVEFWGCLILSEVCFNGTAESHNVFGAGWLIFACLILVYDLLTGRR